MSAARPGHPGATTVAARRSRAGAAGDDGTGPEHSGNVCAAPLALTGMSGRDWSLPCGRICVLDIEGAPDPHAKVLAGRTRGVPRGSPLNEIVAASVLTFEERRLGEFSRFRLRSFHHGRHSERDILANAHTEIAKAEANGVLVTFNGRGFDLPMLWLRQLRWWMCALDAIPRIEQDLARHVDVMLELSLGGLGRWPSLADACASMGFSLEGPVPIGPDPVPPEVRKCERDVAATAVLFLHVMAAGRRSPDPLRVGLSALGSFLREEAAGRGHLERLALARMLRGAQEPWGG